MPFSENPLATLRPALLRYCTRLLGSVERAEDVVQEAFLIALNKPASGDPAAYLFGIARRLCQRAQPRYAHLPLDDDWVGEETDDPLQALLQRERGAVLEAAFARLDATSRTLLTARYLEERPVQELAREQGVSENAASLRLLRARQALEDVLVRELKDTARVHGLISSERADGWQSTTIYCLRCGCQRMQGRLTADTFALRCPECDASRPALAGLSSTVAPLPAARVLAGASGFRVGLRRVNAWWQSYLSEGLRRGKAACVFCGACAHIRPGWPGGSPGFFSECTGCQKSFFVAAAGLLMHSDEGQRFWSEQGRLRFAGQETLRFQGREAVRVCFEARGSAAQLEAIYAADDLTRLH